MTSSKRGCAMRGQAFAIRTIKAASPMQATNAAPHMRTRNRAPMCGPTPMSSPTLICRKVCAGSRKVLTIATAGVADADGLRCDERANIGSSDLDAAHSLYAALFHHARHAAAFIERYRGPFAFQQALEDLRAVQRLVFGGA
jgi:hypothetical protein